MYEPKAAVAVKYSEAEDNAPRVVAKGWGTVAEKIIQIAEQYNVPTYEDEELSRLLAALDVDFEIPPELYYAVAEVLVFIYNLENRIEEFSD